MTIVFLCSSLRLGYDGVGDYTRRLAGELIRQGHRATIIALNEPDLAAEQTERQPADGVSVSVLRLPASTRLSTTTRRVKDWIANEKPDWISLQFVPFGFQDKGLPVRLILLLTALGRYQRWHVMFHELWVGMEKSPTPAMFWWGNAQKQLIRTLLAIVRPTVIHTQMRLYQEQLRRLGYRALYLPLFSNIPVASAPAGGALPADGISLVNFGGLHPGAPVEPFAEEVRAYSERTGVPVTMTLVGRCGSQTDAWVGAWEKTGGTIRVLGEQAPGCVSDVLHQASLGITTNPLSRVEKSGTVAALLAHGLPVLCVAHSWKADGIDHDQEPLPGILAYEVGNLERCLHTPRRSSAHNDISRVGAQFIDTLSQ